MSGLGIRPEDWPELARLLDVALELPPDTRATWVEELDPRYEALKPELRRLLAASGAVETREFLADLPRLGPVPGGAAEGAGQVGDRVGPYRLVRELGTGGMGVVWLAERADGLLERSVALKMPRGAWVRDGLRERMARERRILGALEHPGIARLYDAGVGDDGRPFLAMEYVEGEPLDAYCAARELDTRARLALYLQVVDAVAYAHSKLVIHRDLKPANILVTADGQVRLLDFGIAKLMDRDVPANDGATEFGSIALTPDYASPEQVRGEPLTLATDVYSLGVVLYELLSGERPYRLRRASRAALEEAIVEADARRPSEVAKNVARRRALRGDLDAIVLHALRKDASARYPSAHALADDLRRHLAGQPVNAQPDRAAYRLRKFVLRHRLAAVAAGAATLALLLGAGVALWQAQVARAEAERARTVAQFVESIFESADPNVGTQARAVSARELLDRAQRRIGAELRGQPGIADQLRTVIARSYLGLAEPEAALAVLVPMIDGEREQPRPDGARLRALHLLAAEATLALNRPDDSERHVRAVDDLGARAPHPDWTVARLIESEIAYARGRYDECARVAELVLAAGPAAVANRPELLARLHEQLGKAYGMQRRKEDSVAHNTLAYRAALEAAGGDHAHPRVFEIEESLGASLMDVGRWAEANVHLERALASARATLGDESLVAARYATRLAYAQLEQGRVLDAIAGMERAIEIERRYEVTPSLAGAGRLRALARARIAARRHAAAIEPLIEALAIARRLDNAPIAAVLEADAAFARAAAGEPLEPALATLARVIAAQDAGEARWKTHLPDHYAGVLLRWAGRTQDAVGHLQRGVELARKQSRVSELGDALAELGLAQADARELDLARAALDEASTVLKMGSTAATPVQADVTLGRARLALGADDRARAVAQAAIATAFWRVFAPESRDAGIAAYWEGRTLAAAGREADARTALAAAHRVLVRSPWASDARLAADAAPR